MSLEMTFTKTSAAVLSVVILALLGFLMFVPDGKVDYCYLDSYSNGEQRVYTLNGHRRWRVDRLLFKSFTLDETVDAAQKMGCEVK